MLDELIVPPLSPEWKRKALEAIDAKTKPKGSLGILEAIAAKISSAQETLKPEADPSALLLFAGDHGMVEEGVSAWPSEVTAQMALNFLSGGAAANVFARTNGVEIIVADAGVSGELPDSERLIRAGIRKGTRNAMERDAMTHAELDSALRFGAELARSRVEAGARVILLGEMGIGNTSSATLLTHALEGISIQALAGPGAGLDALGVERKIETLRKIASRRSGPLPPTEALCAFGGFEIASMAGALIGAASCGALVLADGFISSAAALCALRARPEAKERVMFAHRSAEPGHRAVLEALEVQPLLELDLRLGEGTGALLAFPLLRNACAMLRDMATFEAAEVSGPTGK